MYPRYNWLVPKWRRLLYKITKPSWARSVALGFKTRAAKSHPNLAKQAFSKHDHAFLAGTGFETGATERALIRLVFRFAYQTTVFIKLVLSAPANLHSGQEMTRA
jgi:hypothetical protein